jgi:cytochrome c oxidase subunit 2
MTPALLAWLEPPASTSAQNHDFVFFTLLYVMAFFFILVVAIMLAFVLLYRRRKGRLPDGGPTHNTPLEIFWTAIPLGIVIGFFVLGMKYYVDIEAPPPGSTVIDVEASQWQFNFKYPNGAESNELYLEVDKPVVLKLASKDVTHALYIPAFRIQRNAVPGQWTELWFQPTQVTGTDPGGEERFHHVFCTQYCGNGHADMRTRAYVLAKADYDRKLAEAANIFVDRNTKEPLPLAKVGETLYTKMGCAQCHTVDGANGTGPTWKGLHKRDHEFDKSNEPGYSLAKSDDDAKWDAYLREAILYPERKLVKGFPNSMPPQASALSGSPYKEKKLTALVEYIKSVGDPKDYRPLETPKAKTSETASAGAAPPPDDKPVQPPVDRSDAAKEEHR